MQKLLLIILLSCISTFSFGQSESNNWFVNSEEAVTYAKERQVNVLMVFAGSDWCKPCIQFKADILKSEAFDEYSKDMLAILYLDFPAKKKNRLSKAQTTHNENLAEKYNRGGAFPKIILMNPELTILAEPKFKGQSPETFVAELKSNI